MTAPTRDPVDVATLARVQHLLEQVPTAPPSAARDTAGSEAANHAPLPRRR